METMTQAQIDELVNRTEINTRRKTANASLTAMEMDTIGEIGNISMGTSATTLSKLLNKPVIITTPRVSVKSLEQLYLEYPQPNIVMEIEYIHGLKGKNLLIMKEEDVKIITDLLMGGDGTGIQGEIDELHISAIGEVMNQMIGSSSTALSEMLNMRIDISPPKTFKTDFGNDLPIGGNMLVVVMFRMEIESINDTDFMLLMPLDFTKKLISMSLKTEEIEFDIEPEKSVPKPKLAAKKQVNVSRINYEELDEKKAAGKPRPLELLKDVPLEIKVEIGKTVKTVKEVLELGTGSVIELDRSAGDDVDIILNGRYIAKGEVVVVDDSYGVRITEILEE